jgi:glycosyltransferase involved in cell wall biosynthesis
MTISAFLPVFNEETRIIDTLKSFNWCDEIIVVDKESTDNTVELVKMFSPRVKIVSMKNTSNYDPKEWTLFLENCASDWVIFVTASNVIHPLLAKKIQTTIRESSDSYDVLNIPFRRFVLGLETKKSPWYSELSPKVMKKSAMTIVEGGVHDAVQFSGRELNIRLSSDCAMYHLTHESADGMVNNHLRYWRGEAKGSPGDLVKPALRVCKEFIRIIFFKRTYLMGWDGIMLMFAYLSYFMMSFVYRWEQKRGMADKTYSLIRESISKQWSEMTRDSLEQ